jgi:hypothetical protein
MIPDTVQTDAVLDEKATARPEDAVALSAKGAVPNAWFGIAANVIVWVPAVTVKLWLTAVAGA